MQNVGEKLRKEIEADASEAWKPNHALAMECFALEEVLQKGMAMFRRIRDEDQAWTRRVQSGAVAFDPEVARYFRDRYEHWFQPCDWALGCIQHYEKEYRIISGSEDFKLARRLVKSILSTPIDRVVESMEQIARREYEVI